VNSRRQRLTSGLW